MFKKKLLTLAGIVGILVCGACYLPPSPQHVPPPPPIRNELKGIQSIRVEVVNTSPTHHLNPDALAQKVAETINQLSGNKINAHAGKEARGKDAVLVITVLNEAMETTTNTGSMTFLIWDSAALSKQDGTRVWQETATANWITYESDEKNGVDVWNVPGLVDSIDEKLSYRLVNSML